MDVLTFYILSASLCKANGQCNPPLLRISNSGIICDVILAIDLESVPA